MALTSAGFGTQTAILDTEHTLDTEASSGVYVLVVDASNMAAGDTLMLWAKIKYASGGTSRICFPPVAYTGEQTEPIIYSAPIPTDTEVSFVLEQTDGTGRDFYWNLLKLGTVTSAGNGTQTATIDTEHTLDTETTAGTYVLVVDASNMAAGDKVTLKIKTKYATGGTSRIAFDRTYSYNQVAAVPIIISPPVPVDTEIIATLEQTDGTGRDFYWNLLKL